MMQRNRRIVRNALRCTGCGDVIESKHRHEIVTCSCGAWSVDGGLDYIKRSIDVGKSPFPDSEDLCEYDPPLEDNEGSELPDWRL